MGGNPVAGSRCLVFAILPMRSSEGFCGGVRRALKHLTSNIPRGVSGSSKFAT